MKIGCTGAGGTGKTTALKLLEKTVPETALPSVARMVFQELGVQSEDEQLSWGEEQLWNVQRTMIERKLERDQVTPSFLCDRTPLDHWAYALFRCNSSLSRHEEFSYWENEVRDALRVYDVIFYFPTGLFVAPDDGLRVQSSGYHALVDGIIHGYLTRWRVPHFAVNFEGPSLRADVMLSEITRLRVSE